MATILDFITIFGFVIIPLLWTAYQIWRAWPGIVASARQQADIMDDMPLADAAKFTFLGKAPQRPEDE